jgi:hypothetical protein
VRPNTLTAVIGSLVLAFAMAGCDDEENPQPTGGGPGYSTPASNVLASGEGFCDPVGGESALGQADYASTSTAKIDTDGDPNAQGRDPDWQPHTSGQVNGGDVNSARYNYVVMSRQQMQSSGVGLGDWAQVTNEENGASTWAKVMDIGPPGGEGEVSEAAANSVGIQFQPSSATLGNPSVTVKAYAQTAGIQSDCTRFASN